MRHLLLFVICFSCITSFSQLNLKDGISWATEHRLVLSAKYEVDIGIKNHAAPIIMTRNGGIAIIGNFIEVETEGVKIVVLNAESEIIFTHFFGPYADNLEAQGIIEDRAGHFYVIMETHDKIEDNDTRERVVKIDHSGKIKWDIALEQKDNHYHRHCNTIVLNSDGKSLDMRGTVQPDKTAIVNKEHYKWTANLDGNGVLIHEIGKKLGK